MSKVHRIVRVISLAAIIGAGAHAVLAAETKTPAFSSDPAAIQSRLENVRRLVTNSSGAKRIIESGNREAAATRAEAEKHLYEAEKAVARKDYAAAKKALQEATESMFVAVRVIGTGKDGVEKQKRDFDNKAASVDVLLNAIERVAKEKGGKQAVLDRAQAIRQQAASAQKMAAGGDIQSARKQLDTTYEQAKLELEKLREGETLVRTLDFASPEEEYRYELDRNDTHKMLLTVLLSDKDKSPGMQKLIDGYVEKSGDLRQQAEQAAARGAFKKGVQDLEEATRYLQRAIRSAGVYIPG